VLRGVVDLQPIRQALGIGRREGLVERAGTVGVEVVHDQDDPLGLRVVHVHQLLDDVCPVELGPPLGDRGVSPAAERLAPEEQVRRPVPLVLVRRSACCSRRSWGLMAGDILFLYSLWFFSMVVIGLAMLPFLGLAKLVRYWRADPDTKARMRQVLFMRLRSKEARCWGIALLVVGVAMLWAGARLDRLNEGAVAERL
jgi:hypothetical protein